MTRLVNDQGHTVVDGNINPESEEIDQMGEIIHALKTYYDWTGDDSLLRKHRIKIRAMIELPLRPQLLDPATGTGHNRREYWERAWTDAYELIYQASTVYGLRAAADLATVLDAEDRAPAWRADADKMWNATVNDPKMKLVENGKLIKRRQTNGQAFNEFGSAHPFDKGARGNPVRVQTTHKVNPDSSASLPIALGVLNPHSDLAQATLNDLESLWNERWFTGGYGRYASACEIYSVGPSPIATATIMRAQHDAGMFDRSRRSLTWLAKVGFCAYLETTPPLADSCSSQPGLEGNSGLLFGAPAK